MADWEHGGFGLYIHWPFCAAKCPYCDFNSHVSQAIDQKLWTNAYLSELDRVATLTKGRVLQTVFFGGGTPSLMAPETVAAVLERIRRLWPMVNDPEITLEANPGSVEAGRFKGFSDAGINRVSMGFQALNNRDLRALGRIHTVEEARKALDIAQSSFDRVSFDLIYARQHQTLQDWQAELSEALAMGPSHLSLYQLTIEQGTAFGDRYNAGKLRGLPDDDLAADMYFATQDLCEKAGLPGYEVSNHAKAGDESRHNLIYWRYGDYIGIGPGAHGRVTISGKRHATETWLMPNKWLDAANAGTGENLCEPLPKIDQAREYLMMGLRIREGISMSRIRSLYPDAIADESVSSLVDMRLVKTENGRLVVTDSGRPVLNSILTELLP